MKATNRKMQNGKYFIAVIEFSRTLNQFIFFLKDPQAILPNRYIVASDLFDSELKQNLNADDLYRLEYVLGMESENCL